MYIRYAPETGTIWESTFHSSVQAVVLTLKLPTLLIA
jgi:hypothetical protein